MIKKILFSDTELSLLSDLATLPERFLNVFHGAYRVDDYPRLTSTSRQDNDKDGIKAKVKEYLVRIKDYITSTNQRKYGCLLGIVLILLVLVTIGILVLYFTHDYSGKNLLSKY